MAGGGGLTVAFWQAALGRRLRNLAHADDQVARRSFTYERVLSCRRASFRRTTRPPSRWTMTAF